MLYKDMGKRPEDEKTPVPFFSSTPFRDRLDDVTSLTRGRGKIRWDGPGGTIGVGIIAKGTRVERAGTVSQDVCGGGGGPGVDFAGGGVDADA